MSSIGKGIFSKRVLSVIINVLLVSSLLFDPFSPVFAQEFETPTPSDIIIPLVTVTEMPKLAPTQENSPTSTIEPSLDPTITSTEIHLPDSTGIPADRSTLEPEFGLTILSKFDDVTIASGTSITLTPNSFKHTCVLTMSGGVKCWGDNYYGQLGDGTTINKLIPIDVAGLKSGVTAISVSWGHSCAITSEGGVKCWGSNGSGQLGDGTKTSRLTPVDVVGLTSGVTAISVGSAHTCAITSVGSVKCWGASVDRISTNRLTPVDIAGLSSGVVKISSGSYFTCVLTDGGGVKCWGSNNYGQLGDGTTNYNYNPVDVVGLTSGVTAISAGPFYTCVLTNSGGVKCWGRNEYGQIGDGTTVNKLIPIDVAGMTSGISVISTGWIHSCALTSEGGAKCWGQNFAGALGDGTTIDRHTPVDVIGLFSGVRAVSAGWVYSCAIAYDWELKCWGAGDSGQLGDGTSWYRLTPVNVICLNGQCVSGSVVDSKGQPVTGVTINSNSGDTTITSGQGEYVLQNLPEGVNEIIPNLDGRTFSPPSQMINIYDSNLTGYDFVLDQEKYPVILLPGIMGSRLSNTPKSDPLCALRPHNEIWLDLVNFLMMPNSLYLNANSPTPYNSCDSIEPSGILDSGVFDKYSKTIAELRKPENGGYTVYPFPYDWRLSLEDSAVKLDQFINENKGSSQKVILLGHSMGGLLARTYIAEPARAEKVAQVITVGSPYWGAPKLALSMRTGLPPLDTKIPLTDYYIALLSVANIARNSPGAMQLLPSDSYISSVGYYYIDDKTPLSTWGAVKDFFISNEGKSGLQNSTLLDDSWEFHHKYDDLRVFLQE